MSRPIRRIVLTLALICAAAVLIAALVAAEDEPSESADSAEAPESDGEPVADTPSSTLPDSFFGGAVREQDAPVEPLPAPAVFDGEKLTYLFGWSGLNAAEATISAEVVDYHGKRCYRIVNEIRSRPVLDWIWKVRDRIEVYSEVDTLRPLHYEFIQREGKFNHDTVIDFDHEAKIARAERRYKGKVKKTTVRFDELYDPMTALYVMRRAGLSPGDRAEIDAFDGKRVHTIEYRVVGADEVKTKFGEKDALVVEPRILKSDPPYKKKESDKSTEVRTVTIYLDEADGSTIYRIESDVSVGEVYAELIER